MGHARAVAVTASNAKDILEKNLNSPRKIYNMDESGMPLDHKPSKVITLRASTADFEAAATGSGVIDE